MANKKHFNHIKNPSCKGTICRDLPYYAQPVFRHILSKVIGRNGNPRQIEDVNRSKIVVEIGVFYYRCPFVTLGDLGCRWFESGRQTGSCRGVRVSSCHSHSALRASCSCFLSDYAAIHPYVSKLPTDVWRLVRALLVTSTNPDLYLHPTILPSYFPPTKKSARRHYGDERRSCSVQTTLNIFLLGFSIFFSPPDIFNCLSRLLLLFSNKNWFPWNIHTTFQESLYFSLRWHPLWCTDLFAVYESYYYTISISRSWLSRFL